MCTTATILWQLYWTTCVNQLRTEGFCCSKVSLPDSNQCIQISEKMLEFSLTVLPTLSSYHILLHTFIHIIMAALWNRTGHYIFALWLLSIFLLLSSFFSLAYELQTGCLPYFYTRCGLSANLECRSEMCCTRLAKNTGRKKSPSGHHRTTLSGYIFVTKACIEYRQSEKTC